MARQSSYRARNIPAQTNSLEGNMYQKIWDGSRPITLADIIPQHKPTNDKAQHHFNKIFYNAQQNTENPTNNSRFPSYVKPSENPYFDEKRPEYISRENVEGYLAYNGLGMLPQVPQRSFWADFPDDYQYDNDTGRMKMDVDGRPIHPDAVVVGRQRAHEGDMPLYPHDADKIIEGLTKKPVEYTHFINPNPNAPPVRMFGLYEADETTSIPGKIYLDAREDRLLLNRVKLHELGHALDHIGGTHSQSMDDLPEKVREQFYSIYNVQKNRHYNRARIVDKVDDPLNTLYGSGYTVFDDGYKKWYDPKTLTENDERSSDDMTDTERSEMFAEAFLLMRATQMP